MRDEYFAKIEVNFPFSHPKAVELSNFQFAIYIKYWCLAVRERRTVLPARAYTLRARATMLHTRARALQSAEKRLHELGLLEVTEEYINVLGVKEKHKKVPFVECTQLCTDNLQNGSGLKTKDLRLKTEDIRHKTEDPPLTPPDEISLSRRIIRDYPDKLKAIGVHPNSVPLASREEKNNPGWDDILASEIEDSIKIYFAGDADAWQAHVQDILARYGDHQLVDSDGRPIKLYTFKRMIGDPALMRMGNGAPTKEQIAQIERAERTAADAR